MEPTGIVRLSDLMPAGSADPPSKAGPALGHALPRARGSRVVAETDPVTRPHPRPHAEPAAQATTDEAASGVDVPYEGLFGPDGDSTKKKRRPARPPLTAAQRAIGLLTRREHSRKELARKLIAKGLDAEEVEKAVGKLADAGWQDERRFAESLVRSRAAGGYGPLHIRAELGTHDLPAELRQQVLEEFEGDWLEMARDAAIRRFGRIEDPRLRERKAGDYLIRRGFPSDIARSASRFDPAD